MSWALLIVERPLIPISLARRTRSCLLQSSYELFWPPLLPTWLREVAAAALAIRADFSVLSPWSRSFRYVFSSLICALGTGFSLLSAHTASGYRVACLPDGGCGRVGAVFLPLVILRPSSLPSRRAAPHAVRVIPASPQTRWPSGVAEQARERSLVSLRVAVGAQGPAVDGFQAHAPQAFADLAVTPDASGPQVQVMVGGGLRLLGVLLAQQA